MKKRKDDINEKKFNLMLKTILMSGMDVENYNKQIESYNKKMNELEKLLHPEIILDTERFVDKASKDIKKLKDLDISKMFDFKNIKRKSGDFTINVGSK